MRLRSSIGAVVFAGCAFEPAGLAPSGDDVETPIDARTADGALALDGPSIIDAGACGDVDRDGICDTDDDWNCGPIRPTLALPTTFAGLTISEVSINFGDAYEQSGPNQSGVFGVRYDFTDGNASQSDQIEIGVAGGTRLDCRGPGDTTFGWSTPISYRTSSAGVVRLTAQVAHENNCSAGPRTDGWAGPAPTSPIIGAICVR